ncbi:GTPase-associated system all-helical protein GASH [Maribacter stanieri]|uniref:GTPase-associated system all-helical protein GASH n=1 Tax=Maribacter stanieri TaxID=440514 RepID=UPI0030D85E9A|tara:strand:- start:5842 stop:7113 length:1272 start_codon:yes stop_codon:yes gene_type:complete
MDDNFLQSTLKSGLFDIGDSDDRLKWLEQSVAALVKYLQKNYSLLPRYSLVALDPNISDREPILKDIEEIVTKYWKALRGKYPDMPRNIHRGVILNSLMQLGIEDPVAARIISLTSTNFYPYTKLGKEKDIVHTLLTELGEIAEKHAVEEWSLIEEEPKLKLSTLKVSDIKPGNVTVSNEKIKSAFKNGLAAKGPSGHHIGHGFANADFQQAYISETSEGITGALNLAFKDFNQDELISGVESSINKFFTNFKKSLDENLKASFASILAVERRSKLLWWKETLYSPSLRKSYREVSQPILPIIMGTDLNDQVAKITPISVDYLLRDTLLILIEKKDEKIKFKDFFNSLIRDSTKSEITHLLPEINESDGRISITDFIVLFLHNKTKLEGFTERTGIREDDEISIEDLSVAIFHDLLTKRLSSK